MTRHTTSLRRTRRFLLAAALATGCTQPGPSGDPIATPTPGGKADEIDNVPAEVVDAALANLERVSREIDGFHLSKYALDGTTAEQFLEALEREYASDPAQLEARVKALGSMIFFAAPEILPPEGGKLTPFHGLSMDDFEQLMHIEDRVWYQHQNTNGGKVGVRPFSVCETTFMIETFVKTDREFPADFETYRAEYAAYAASCPEADLLEWYNFRGLGHLRPSWIESNIQERVLRRNVDICDVQEDPDFEEECAEWNQDRRAYRERVNSEMATRFMFYDPATQQDYFSSTHNDTVLLRDTNDDGVGEFLRNGAGQLATGETVEIRIDQSGQFGGAIKTRREGGQWVSTSPEDLVLESAIDPGYDASWMELPDFGLTRLFPDGTGCTGEIIDPSACPLMKRFYVLIDRHESFYNTYSALNPTSSRVSSQPSPLVACSVTLEAAHNWDTAGIPEGGTAGFIFLMRIPFKQILAGSRKSVATLMPGPEVLAIQDIYDGGGELDLDEVWLDIASLSNDLYSSENEISKFGAVPAHQIEGILVVRRPAAMGGGGTNDDGHE